MCLGHRISTGDFVLLQNLSGVVCQPNDIQVPHHIVSIEWKISNASSSNTFPDLFVSDILRIY